MNSRDWTLGIDIGGTKILLIQVDKSGKVVHQIQIKTQAEKGFDFIYNEILQEITKLIKRVHTKPKAIGIGIAGQVIYEDSYLKGAPNLKWYNLPLKEIMENALGIPVRLINDARAAIWEEWVYGSSQGLSDLVCLMIGTGIGGGIISQNNLITGSCGAAGEIGHFPVDLSGPRCSCGSHGCLEAISSGWAITFHAKEAIRKNKDLGTAILELTQGDIDTISTRQVLLAAQRGDPLAGSLIDRAIEAIVSACIGLSNFLNPSRILIGGGLGLALPHICEKIKHGINSRSLEAVRNLEVLPIEFKENAVALGAAGYAKQKLEVRLTKNC